MRRLPILPWLTAMNLLFVGCGDDTSNPGDAASGSAGAGSSDDIPEAVEIDELGDHYAAVYCARAFGCCDSEEITELVGGSFFGEIDNEQSCRDVYAGLVQSFVVPVTRASIERGFSAYDAEAAADCLRVFASADCGDVPFTEATESGLPTACNAMFVGFQSQGDECLLDTDCETNHCDDSDPSGAEGSSMGVCAVLPAVGEECLFTCAQGLTCDFSSGTCVPPAEDGSPCTDNEECMSGRCEGTTLTDAGECSSAPFCAGS